MHRREVEVDTVRRGRKKNNTELVTNEHECIPAEFGDAARLQTCEAEYHALGDENKKTDTIV